MIVIPWYSNTPWYCMITVFIHCGIYMVVQYINVKVHKTWYYHAHTILLLTQRQNNTLKRLKITYVKRCHNMPNHLMTDAYNKRIKTPCHDACYITFPASKHQDQLHPPEPTVAKVTCIPYNLQSNV